MKNLFSAISATWGWLNGRKVKIGGTISAIGTALSGMPIPLIPGAAPFVLTTALPFLAPLAPYAPVVIAAGVILGGGGYLHDLFKTFGVGQSDAEKIAAAAALAQKTGLAVDVTTKAGQPNITVTPSM